MAGTSRFSMTVMRRNARVTWNVRPRPARATMYGGSVSMRLPLR